jgi:hypothetical protein
MTTVQSAPGGVHMKCTQCRQLLVAFIEKLLPPNEELGVEEHIAKCPLCGKELLRLKNTLSVMEQDTLSRLSPAKRQALFPLIMERVAHRSARIRLRNRFAYSFASAFAIISLFIISLIAFRSQQQTDYFTLFFNPQHLIYSDDAEVNEYVLESLIDDGTVISEVHDAVDDAWIENSALTSLVDDLSEDEIGTLIEKLETLDLNGG